MEKRVYMEPDIRIEYIDVERGFVASNDGYGMPGEAGDEYEDIYNGIF